MRLTRRSRACRDDRGVTMVLFSLLLVALLIIVALVIDYGFVRNTRQDGKVTTDAAVTAGINALAPDAVQRPWRGVCEALGFVRANEPDSAFAITYMNGSGGAVVGSPCNSLENQICVAGAPSTWAWIRATDGDRVIDIRSGYVTPDPSFAEDATSYAGDNGKAASGGCDQLAVIVRDRDRASFGGVVGETGYDTAIRSVGRVVINNNKKGVPAFLMLERKECETLVQQVGSSQGGIIVEASNAGTPGSVHVDSAGTPCVGSNGNSSGAFVVYSTELGTGQDKRFGLRIDGAGTNPKGLLTMYALAAGNVANAWTTPTGVSAEVSSGGIVSRDPIDEKYNPDIAPTIRNLHQTSVGLANASTVPAGFTDVMAQPGRTCGNLDGTIVGERVFINCPSGASAGPNLIFSEATDVVFNGKVTVPGSSALFMPLAVRVIVGGDSGGGLIVNNNGRLGINGTTPFADTNAAARAACSAADGESSRVATLIVFGGGSSGGTEGAINISGRAAICKTTGYLAGPKSLSTHERQISNDVSYHPTCVDKPCALTSGSNKAQNAHLVISGLVRWTAPNRLSTVPPPGSQGTEDLALWTESAQESKVTGVLDAQGVYFLPNALFKMQSPADFQPRDAQFIARKLHLLQGTLQMRPTPNNSVQVDVLEGLSLVR